MKTCSACSEKKPGHNKALMFGQNGGGIELYLCGKHDRELFILGQIKFTAKYQIDLRSYPERLQENSSDDVFADITQS